MSTTRKIHDVEATSSELPAMRALAIAPEVAVIFAPVIGKVMDALKDENGMGELGPAIGAAAADLLGGKLADLALPLLATTYVVVGEGKARERIDLLSTEAINRAFAGRLESLPGVLFLAAEVTFGRFFGVTGAVKRQGIGSMDSTPSIVGAGRRGA